MGLSRVFEISVLRHARFRNNRFAIASRKLGLVFCGAIGGGGFAAATLVRFSDSRMPCVGIGARWNSACVNMTPIHEISDTAAIRSSAAVHHHLEPGGFGFLGGRIVAAPSCIQITLGQQRQS